LKIKIPISAQVRKEARLAAIRYSNSRKPVGTTDYAYRDVRERSEIGFIGQAAFIEHFGLAKSDGIRFDALTRTGKRVEIKVKTAWGVRPDYDIQAVEVGNHDLVVWLLYRESQGRLSWVGTSFPRDERLAQSAVKVAFSAIVDPSLDQLQ